MYIYDPISLLAFGMRHQWPGKTGLHRLSLCAAVDILRYTCCGPAVQLMRPDQKHTANIMILYSALCLNFSIKKLAIIWEDRECVATQVTYSFKHKHKGIPANVTTLESSRLWQCVARPVSPGSLKDLHPWVKNEPQPLLTQCTWSHHKDLHVLQHHCNNINLPFLLHNLPLSPTQITPALKMEAPWKH